MLRYLRMFILRYVKLSFLLIFVDSRWQHFFKSDNGSLLFLKQSLEYHVECVEMYPAAVAQLAER